MAGLTWTASNGLEEIVGSSVALLNYGVFCTISYFQSNEPYESPLVSWLHWIGPLLLGTTLAGFVTLHIWSTGEINLSSVAVLGSWLLIMAHLLLRRIWAARQRRKGLEDEVREPLLGDEAVPPGTSNAWWSQCVPETIDVRSLPLWNRLIFWWMNPLLTLGSQKTIRIEDCPQLGPEDQGTVQYDLFMAVWERQGQKFPGKPQSIVWVLWEMFWPQMLQNGSMALAYLVCLYTGPVMLGVLVTFIGKEDRSALEGIGLVSILLLAKFTQALAERRWYFGVEHLGVWIRSALIAAVYRKGLRLSNAARSGHGAGEIVNYLAVDVQRITDFMWWMHDTWLLPAQTLIALVILFRTVGWGSLSGVAVIFVCMALQIPLAGYTEKIQSKVMAAKDARMKATTEYLKGMRIIKLWAWEDFFRARLESLRATEFRYLSINAALKTGNIFLIYLCPLLVAVVTLGTCVLLGEPLTSAKVFTAIATFRIIQDPLFFLPLLVAELVETSVSLARLQKLFHSEELQRDAVERLPAGSAATAPAVGTEPGPGTASPAVSIRAGTFSWGSGGPGTKEEGDKGKESKKEEWDDAERPILRSIDLEVPQGSRVAICGTVGSGKSSLLSCILGEMTRLSGTVQVRGRVAYVAQSAWIQSGTIEANILFGQPMDRQRYDEAVRVCALKPDLRALPGGDKTEIGERGINLSGGQKQRIQLARAVYQDADVYLMDDPFSAVDAHTGTELFRECVMGALANKTVILVTHQVEFLPAVDTILVMREGEIVQAGPYDDLLDAGTDFGALVDAHNQAMDAVDAAEDSAKDSALGSIVGTDVNESVLAHGETVERSNSLPRTGSMKGLLRQDSLKETSGDGGRGHQLVEEEEREEGSVGMDVYVAYLRQVWGGALVPFIVVALIAYQVTQVSANYWLSYATTPQNNVSPESLIRVYGWLTCGGVLFVLVRTSAVNFGGVMTAQGFFLGMVRSIFRAPMAFFDTTPTGRILSRASSDQTALDLDIPQSFAGSIRNLMELSAILFVTASITPQMLLASIPCGVAVLLLQRYYLKTSREFTRIQGTSKAPILNHFSESVAGAMTIRAFEKSEAFMAHNVRLVDVNNRPMLLNAGASHWFMLRLETLAATVFCTTAVLLVSLPSEVISPALAGLSLAYGLTLNEALCFWAWWSSQLENKIISVERIRQYTSLPSEAPAVILDSRPPPGWPHEGTVEMQHLQVRYRPGTPLVLQDLTCLIRGGTKVGVVGRTGSGKSTLILALFRIVEPAGGKILIDGVDISAIGLKDLRSHLSIIPQEPTLFKGTVRSNMDPMDEFSDAEVWEALDRCQLGDIVRGKDEKMAAAVSDGGENWSVGQRQLFCLGRALLKRSRILVLDEATASVDSATDALIQRTLTTSFAHCTVISVAHRIPTVIDSDRVLVLEQGRVAEYDAPRRLLENKNSMFAKLVSEYSKRSGSMADLASLARIQSGQSLGNLG